MNNLNKFINIKTIKLEDWRNKQKTIGISKYISSTISNLNMNQLFVNLTEKIKYK
jgi:hypothetical protein